MEPEPLTSSPSSIDIRQSQDRRSLALGVLVGATGAIACVSLVACAGLLLFLTEALRSEPDGTVFEASATLAVEPDGCTVVRTEVESSSAVRGLQWVVTDETGDVVLARKATGEYRYTYYRPGTYDVVLQAYDGRSYVHISNHVAIVCL